MDIEGFKSVFRIVGLATALLVVSACERNGYQDDVFHETRSLRPSRVTGCYHVEMKSWSDSEFELPNSVDMNLELVSAEADLIGRRISPAYEADAIEWPWGSEFTVGGRITRSKWLTTWNIVGRDSLRLVWGNGFSHFDMRVQVIDDSVHGNVQFSTDVVTGDPWPSTEVAGWRIGCPEDRLQDK